jgi:hypothetical protein
VRPKDILLAPGPFVAMSARSNISLVPIKYLKQDISTTRLLFDGSKGRLGSPSNRLTSVLCLACVRLGL